MSIGVVIFFLIIGVVICAKARSAGGAITFALIAIVLFIGTPAGSGLPDVMARFVDTVSDASTPLTNGQGAAG